jgi:predicted nucleic acid-binding protein
MTDLIDLPLKRASHRPLLRRCWELRHNLTSYDACYVALAETLNVSLLTADGRLANAPGLWCAVELLS